MSYFGRHISGLYYYKVNNNNNMYYIVLFARATIDDPFIRTIEVM